MLSKLAFAVVLGALFVAPAHAALPPGSYDKLRASAEEAVIIQVETVTKDSSGEVGVSAKVLGVERSKAGLKKGDKIRIKYKVLARPIPGPVPVPLPAPESVYPAFLNKKGDGFEPAAHGWSFKMTPEAVDRKAENVGKAIQTVDDFINASPFDAKAEGLQKAVIGIGQSGDLNGYVWTHARLKWEVWFLKARKGEQKFSPEETKEIDARIALYERTRLLIDAPR